jgi:TonB family protein
MKILASWALAGMAIVCCSFAAWSQAQDAAPQTDRKLIARVEPDYPPVLRMRQIGGTVKLQITITPNGNVDSPKVLGGNPVLAESAVAAVKKWKYAAGEAATTATISLEFNPYR